MDDSQQFRSMPLQQLLLKAYNQVEALKEPCPHCGQPFDPEAEALHRQAEDYALSQDGLAKVIPFPRNR